MALLLGRPNRRFMENIDKSRLLQLVQQMQLLLGESPDRTVADVCNRYFEDRRHRWGAKSYSNNARWRRFVIDRMGGRRAESITVDDGRALRLDGATVGGHSSEFLRRAFAHAERLGWLRFNPLATLSRWTPERRELVLTRGDLARLRAEVEHRIPKDLGAPAAKLITLTGMSNGDARNLRWDEVRVPANKLALPDRKGSGRRLVTISDEAMAWVLVQPALGPWVFPGRSGQKPVSETGLRSAWVAAARMAKLPDVTPHTIRHTMATHAAEAGAGVGDLMEMFGWKSVEAAMVYVHPSGSHLRDLANRIGPKRVNQKKGRRGRAAG